MGQTTHSLQICSPTCLQGLPEIPAAQRDSSSRIGCQPPPRATRQSPHSPDLHQAPGSTDLPGSRGPTGHARTSYPGTSSPALRLASSAPNPPWRPPGSPHQPGGATSRENLALPRAIPIGQARTNEEPLRPVGPAHATPQRKPRPARGPIQEAGSI